MHPRQDTSGMKWVNIQLNYHRKYVTDSNGLPTSRPFNQPGHELNFAVIEQLIQRHNTKACSKPCRALKVECLAKIVDG